jgi:hypothetical protein
MYHATRIEANKAALLLLALALAMVAGCRTVTPADMVPEPLAPAPAGRRFDGTVSVGVTIDALSLRYVRPRQAAALDELPALTGLPLQAITEAIAPLGSAGLLPIVPGDPGKRGVSPALAAFAPQYAVDWARTYNPLIKGSVEKSLTASGLFPRTVPAKADYALDIWLDGYEPTTPSMGMGTWKADVMAIWRLTRARDGAILACDSAEGHGSFRSVRGQPNHWAFAAAVQDLIGNILRDLGEDPREHLAALEPAGLGRTGGAGALPAAGVQWAERVRTNWPRLRAGMTREEVSSVIGSVGAPVTGWDCVFIVPVAWSSPGSKSAPPGTVHTRLAFRVYRTDAYTLLFLVNDQPMNSPSPPVSQTLLVWQLGKK